MKPRDFACEPENTAKDAFYAPDVLAKKFQRIVQSAAYSTACPMGVFLRGPWDSLTLAARFGPVGSCRLPIENRLVSCMATLQSSQIAVIEHIGPSGELTQSDVASLSSGTEFLTGAQVINESGTVLGILIVLDVAKHAGLSAAQTYTLLAHAAQLAAAIDLHELRHALREQTASGTSRSRNERLRLLESVVVNANDAVLITEAEPIALPGPRIVYCNKAFEKTTGYTEAEILGKTPRILQTEGTDRKALDRLRAALKAWKPVEVELLNRRKDGSEFWVELSIVPVANEKGWFTHWVSVQREVTDRKIAEEIATQIRISTSKNRALEAEICERLRVEEQLLYEAFHDRLTKLRNRAFFMDRLTEALGTDKHDDKAVHTVLFLDLDGFKLVNDSLGHRAGDLLLMVTAERLQGCIRPQDGLARIGGDEFAVLLENSSLDVGISVANCITKALRQPVMLGSQQVFSSSSIGIAQSTGRHIKADEFLRNADIAMYEAKKHGLGSYAVFADSMHTEVIAALALQTDLRQAIDRDEFELYFQPICNPQTSLITGVEALVRWQHPERGLIAPASFISMAEKIGLVRDIGRWVLREACRQLARWNEHHAPMNLRMNVNVSGDELRDENFISYLRSVLDDTGIPATALHLEITESVFLHQSDIIKSVLEEVRALGCGIALDDFGTGFSSLSYIDQYPIDSIKIDQSFISRMLTHRRTLAIVETIIRLGKALDLQIVAEGVETDEQLAMLRALDCVHAQGYLFAQPMTAEAMGLAIAHTYEALQHSGAPRVAAAMRCAM